MIKLVNEVNIPDLNIADKQDNTIAINKFIPIIDKSIIPKSYPKMFIMLNSLYSHIFNFSTFHQKLLPILHARHY